MIAVLIGFSKLALAVTPDKKRPKGRFVSIGGGPGYTSFTRKVTRGSEQSSNDRTTKGAVATDLKIGKAVAKSFWTYYVNRATWFGQESALVMSMSHHAGMSVYLRDRSPALYWLASAGLSHWNERGGVREVPPEPGSSRGWGLGVSMGLGHELPKSWSVEAVVTYGFAEHKAGGSFFSLATETTWHFSSVMLTINKAFLPGY
jgi:hypothetical protein